MSDFNLLSMDDDALKVYKNPDNDSRGRWRTAPLTVSLLGGARGAAYAKQVFPLAFMKLYHLLERLIYLVKVDVGFLKWF